jgi:hypothetical protein
MDIHIKYVVYELNNIMGNTEHQSLSEITFDGYVRNSFDTEEEAIQALVDDESMYVDFIILKQVHLN